MKETYTSISFPYVENDNIYIDPELYLEPIKLDALKPLYKLMDKDREYLSTFLPWAKSQTQESLQKFIESSIDKRNRNSELVFLIKKNKEILGCISLLQYNPSIFGLPGHANIGYYLFSEHQGRGYMKKALLALTSIYYVNHQINRFQIEVQGKNTKSLKVIESIGAKFEGIARQLRGYDDCRVYSYILPDDFIDHNQQLEKNARAQAKKPIEPLEIPSAVYENTRASNVEFLHNETATTEPNLQDGNVEGFGNVNIVVTNGEAIDTTNSPANPSTNLNSQDFTSLAEQLQDVNALEEDLFKFKSQPINTSLDQDSTSDVRVSDDAKSLNAGVAVPNSSYQPEYSQGDNLDQMVSSLEANLESQIMTGGDFVETSLSQALDQGAKKVLPSTQNDLDEVVDEAIFDISSRNDLDFRSSLELKTNATTLETSPSLQNSNEPASTIDSTITTTNTNDGSTLALDNEQANPTKVIAGATDKPAHSEKFSSSVENVTPTNITVGSSERHTPVTSFSTNVSSNTTLLSSSELDLAKDLDELSSQKSKIELSLEVLDNEINNLNLSTQQLLEQNSQVAKDLQLLKKFKQLTILNHLI